MSGGRDAQGPNDKPHLTAENLGFDATLKLDDLVDRKALDELCASFFGLFGLAIRVYTAEGILLAGATTEHELCAYVNTLAKGRVACGATVDGAKHAQPNDGDITHPCFTGQVYRVVGIDYEGRRIGKLVIGPYAPPALAGVPQSLLDLDPAIDRERARELLAKVPRAKPETVTRIATHLRATLDLILFSGHKSLVTSAMHLASVRESYRDLEEKNTRLQEAYDRLRELDRLKSNFLATVSHELRTPLTSIIGYSEMLKEGIAGDLSDEQKEFVDTIHEKGEQLLRLIQGLLDLSKLDSGTMKMRRQTVGIEPVLREVVSTVTPAARKKNVTVTLQSGGTNREFVADPDRLRQVFLNLVDNALKFTPSGGTITLDASVATAKWEDDDEGIALLAPANERIVVRVADTGIGIPESERERVFDAFYQVDSSSTREYGGTGLGLSIVKRLVDNHGGTIHIEPNSPQGTVFIVSLPVAGAEPFAKSSSAPPSLTSSPSQAPKASA